MIVPQANVQAVSIPAMDIANTTGPSLDTYMEARFRLLDEKTGLQFNCVENTIRLEVQRLEEQLSATRTARQAMNDTIVAQIKAVETNTHTYREAAMRAADKAEVAQQAHNIASNEWRGTLNDFRFTLVSRAEFDRQVEDFAAYRLETSRVLAAMAAATNTVKEVKDDGMSKWALIASLLGVLIAVVAVVLTHGTGMR